jgi:hypothetical protein
VHTLKNKTTKKTSTSIAIINEFWVELSFFIHFSKCGQLNLLATTSRLKPTCSSDGWVFFIHIKKLTSTLLGGLKSKV